MSRRSSERRCPCGAEITHQSKTGRCRTCANRALHADPQVQARRLAGLARHFDKPGARRAAGDRLRAFRATMSDEERQRRSEHGRWLVREYLSRPDVRARALSPEGRAKAVAGNHRAKLGWLPDELRPLYDRLIHTKKLSAAEARAVIEAELPGTVEHARREIANRELAARLRDERSRREAY